MPLFVYQGQWLYSKHPSLTVRNHVFWPGDLDLWPMTLAKISKVHPHTTIRQTVQPWECWITDTPTHTGPILLPQPLTREVLRKGCNLWVLARCKLQVCEPVLASYKSLRVTGRGAQFNVKLLHFFCDVLVDWPQISLEFYSKWHDSFVSTERRCLYF